MKNQARIFQILFEQNFKEKINYTQKMTTKKYIKYIFTPNCK